MDHDINNELEDILGDLQRLSQAVAQRERELQKVREIYLLQDGTDSFELHIDQNVFYVDSYELAALARQMQELGLIKPQAPRRSLEAH